MTVTSIAPTRVPTLIDQLEALVDKYGMTRVLFELEAISEFKADHVSANWQDVGLEREWQRTAKRIGSAARACKLP